LHVDSDRKWRVVYMEVVPPDIAEIISSRLPPSLQLSFVTDYSDEAAISALSEADFALVATHPMPARLIKAGRRLRMIQHQGVGYDKTDVKFAKSQGVPVALCPEGTIRGVAEHVFLLILTLYKQILQADLSVRRGEWRQFSLRANSFEVAGKRLGILGFGRIGEAVARRAVSFEAEVNYFDIKRRSQVEEHKLGVAFKPFTELLEVSDIVSLHLPITPDTYHIMDSHAFGLMRAGSILINTARGELVDMQAMLKALQNGQLGGAGLDVFEIEPPNPDDPLLKMPNVVLTPHIAAGTRDALIAKMDAAFANMIRVTRGELPWHIVEV